jgi:hypothetical protein
MKLFNTCASPQDLVIEWQCLRGWCQTEQNRVVSDSDQERWDVSVQPLAVSALYSSTQQSIRIPSFVILAKVGIRAFQSSLDLGFRRGDGTSIGHLIRWTCT